MAVANAINVRPERAGRRVKFFKMRLTKCTSHPIFNDSIADSAGFPHNILCENHRPMGTQN